MHSVALRTCRRHRVVRASREDSRLNELLQTTISLRALSKRSSMTKACADLLHVAELGVPDDRGVRLHRGAGDGSRERRRQVADDTKARAVEVSSPRSAASAPRRQT